MKNILPFFKQCLVHSRRCQCTNQAAALSFDTLLALVPFLILAFTLLSYFPIAPELIVQTEHWLLSHIVNDAGGTMTANIDQVLDQSRQLSLPSVVGLVFSTWLLMHNLQESLSCAWRARSRAKHVLLSFIYGLAMLLVPLVLTYSLMASTYLSHWLPFTSHLLSLSSCFVWLLLTYRLLPSAEVPWKSALISATLATITLTLLRSLLLAYFSWFDGYTIIYGAFVSIPIFLVWLFLIWLVILWGSIMGYTWITWTASDTQHSSSES